MSASVEGKVVVKGNALVRELRILVGRISRRGEARSWELDRIIQIKVDIAALRKLGYRP